jgi:hypothetical protein
MEPISCLVTHLILTCPFYLPLHISKGTKPQYLFRSLILEFNAIFVFNMEFLQYNPVGHLKRYSDEERFTLPGPKEQIFGQAKLAPTAIISHQPAKLCPGASAQKAETTLGM